MINPGIFGSSDDRKNKDLPKISETKNSTAEAIVENAKSAIAINAVEILITERMNNFVKSMRRKDLQKNHKEN